MIERFQFQRPQFYRGLESEGVPVELIRRLEENDAAMLNALRAQMVVDSGVLPAIDGGQAQNGTQSLSTVSQSEDARVFSILWEG